MLFRSLPRECNNGKGMLSSVEQAFVGREEIRASLKTPAWEAIHNCDRAGLARASFPAAFWRQGGKGRQNAPESLLAG